MTALLYSLISAFIVSLISLIGLFSLAIKENFLQKILIYLVSFSAGGLMGGAFFHLLPEAISDKENTLLIFIYLMIGFCLFFLVEKFLRWHHCHDQKCETSAHLGYLNLIGDGVHNFIDGIIIVTTFLVSPGLGLATTLSIVSHEIPQELGDFGVLLYAGFTKKKALFFNFLSAVIAMLGVLVGYFLINSVGNLTSFFVPAAAGGFIYIAATDLIPELQKILKTKHSILTFSVFILALILMLLFKIFAD